MRHLRILDNLRVFINRVSRSPEKELLKRGKKVNVSLGNRKKRVKKESVKDISFILYALRAYIYRVSGSAEKEAERAEKGFKVRTFEALGARIVDSEKKVLRFSNRRLVFLTSMVVVIVVVAASSFTSWSVGYTSSEKFCISCHEMRNAYKSWKTSSHYDNQTGVVASCADCHLPTDTISKIKVKIVTGVRDTFVHYLGNPERLDFKKLASKARKNITDDSCVKCHKNLFPSAITKGGLIAHRALERGEKKKCVDCHMNLVHNYKPYYGAIAKIREIE